MITKVVLFVLTSLFLFACARPPGVVLKPDDALTRRSWQKTVIPRDDLNFTDAAAAARQSLEYYKKIPQDTVFPLGPDKASALDMAVTLQNFLLIVENNSLSTDQKIERIRNDFTLYRAIGSDGAGRVLFTGYYEPLLSCRISADETFRFPLYRKPDDIIEVDLTLFGNGFPKNKLFGRLDNKMIIPSFSREEIDQNRALADRKLEILWCSNLVDVFFLQVQGSGKVDMGDGNIMSVLYDGANGHPYRSIGRYLIDTGAMTKENMSMQAIRVYLGTHPDELNEVLNQNASYVFFRLDTGPSRGNINVPLTPGRSVATDSALFPKGALGFIVTQKPVIEDGVIKEWVPFTRFVLNQDTGGAIKGPGRADLFFGHGPDAELGAGNFQHEGELFFLVRKK